MSDEGVQRLDSLIKAQPDEFAGMEADPATHTLKVYLPGAHARQALDRISTLARSDRGDLQWRLRFSSVDRSLRQLNDTMARVTSQQPWASLAKDALSVWYVDPTINKVHVGVTTLTPALASAAAEAFGDSVQLVQQERPVTANKTYPRPATLRTRKVSQQQLRKLIASERPQAAAATSSPNRLLDALPYWGGDRIVRVSGNYVYECTGAFDWTTPSVSNVMTTAGHCAPNNTTWLQGYFDQSTSTIYYTGNMGLVYSVQWGNNRIDAELMTDSGGYYDPYVYTGTPICGTACSFHVQGTAAPVVGMNVGLYGSFTYQSAGRISATNVCANVNDNGTIVKVCYQAIADSTTGAGS